MGSKNTGGIPRGSVPRCPYCRRAVHRKTALTRRGEYCHEQCMKPYDYIILPKPKKPTKAKKARTQEVPGSQAAAAVPKPTPAARNNRSLTGKQRKEIAALRAQSTSKKSRKEQAANDRNRLCARCKGNGLEPGRSMHRACARTAEHVRARFRTTRRPDWV
ncbi:hypothetical protein [Streptomyces xanthophaeus]